MKTTESICPKSWEQTLSLERRVGSSSQAESVRTWLSLSQEEGGSFKIRTAGLKVCTCSQRGKKPEILTGERERKAGCYLSKITYTFQEAIKTACSCQMNVERALISILAGNDPFPS